MGSPVREVKKVVKNPVKAVKDVVNDPLKVVRDVVVDPITSFGEQLEDSIREGIDEVDKAIQNPYVRLAVNFIPGIGPTAAKLLDAYATLDSGEELSAGQIASLATAGVDASGGTFNLTPEQTKAITTGIRVAENPDNAVMILAGEYGPGIVEELGVEEAAKTALENVVGEGTYNILKENTDIAQVGWDVLVEGKDALESAATRLGGRFTEGLDAVNAELANTFDPKTYELIQDAVDVGKTGFDVLVRGKDPYEVIAENYGDTIANSLNAETESERAYAYGGLKTLTELAQGKDINSALTAGAKTTYDEGGQLPDVNLVANTTGYSLADLGFDFGNLQTPEFIKQFGADVTGSAPDLAFVEDYVRTYSPYIEDAVRAVDLGVDFKTSNLADLSLDKYDFSGLGIEDLGDYSAFELADLGIDLGQLDLSPELRNLGLALATETIPGSQVTRDGEEIASLTSEFDIAPSDEPLFSREVLGRSFT